MGTEDPFARITLVTFTTLNLLLPRSPRPRSVVPLAVMLVHMVVVLLLFLFGFVLPRCCCCCGILHYAVEPRELAASWWAEKLGTCSFFNVSNILSNIQIKNISLNIYFFKKIYFIVT